MIANVSMMWTRGAGFFSRTIRRLDYCVWQGQRYPAAINHVGWRFHFGSGLTLVSESHIGAGVQITPWSHIERAHVAGKVEWIYLCDLRLTDKDKLRLWQRCEQAHGKQYDVLQILWYWWWMRVLKRRGAPRMGHSDWVTCNEHVVQTGSNIVDGLSMNGTHLTPEALFEKFVGRPSAVEWGRYLAEMQGLADTGGNA